MVSLHTIQVYIGIEVGIGYEIFTLNIALFKISQLNAAARETVDYATKNDTKQNLAVIRFSYFRLA